MRNIRRIVGFVCAGLGLVVLGYVVLPISTYSLDNGTQLKGYLSPVPEDITNAADYTKASSWFPTAPQDFDVSKVRYYNLSIPSLGIFSASVAIGGEDLAASLIQYPGTALPGKRGNSVIFGHSILPQFFNPEDYLSIFSTLPTIKKGDQAEIRYDGISYVFVVENVFEVEPTDLEILAQNLDDSYITLVTCTPPGHPLRPKRLIVRARLDPLGTLSDEKLSGN
jgi:sortase A